MMVGAKPSIKRRQAADWTSKQRAEEETDIPKITARMMATVVHL